MAKQILNNGDSALVFRTKLNDNFTELYNEKAPTNHASLTTDYGVATTANYGHIKVTTGNGLMLSSGALSMNLGTTSIAGAIQMIDSYSSTSTSFAPTANALKNGIDSTVKTYSGTTDPSSGLGKNGDLYIKTA